MTLRMNLNHLYTPGIPENLIGTLELHPRGLYAKLVHFWTKVQKPNQISILSHMVHIWEDLQAKPCKRVTFELF
jgi:hypothetical protein